MEMATGVPMPHCQVSVSHANYHEMMPLHLQPAAFLLSLLFAYRPLLPSPSAVCRDGLIAWWRHRGKSSSAKAWCVRASGAAGLSWILAPPATGQPWVEDFLHTSQDWAREACHHISEPGRPQPANECLPPVHDPGRLEGPLLRRAHVPREQSWRHLPHPNVSGILTEGKRMRA